MYWLFKAEHQARLKIFIEIKAKKEYKIHDKIVFVLKTFAFCTPTLSILFEINIKKIWNSFEATVFFWGKAFEATVMFYYFQSSSTYYLIFFFSNFKLLKLSQYIKLTLKFTYSFL